MTNHLRLFTAPTFPDEEQTRVAQLLHWILLSVTVLNLFDVTLLAIFAPETIPTFWVNGIFFLGTGFCFWLMRRGNVQLACLVFCLAFWTLLTYYLSISGGVTSPSIGLLSLGIIMAAVLLGVRGALGIGFLTVTTVALLYWAGNNGSLQLLEERPTPARLFATQSVTFLALTMLMAISGRSVWNTLIRARRDEKDLAERNQQLQQEIEARQQYEEAYKSLVENSLQGLFIYQDNRLVFANKAIADTLGYTIESLLALEDPFSFIYPDDRPLVTSYAESRLRGDETPSNYEFRFVRKDGAVCWAEIFAVPIIYRGRPAIQTTTIDITERKQAELRIQETEAELRQLTDATFEGIVISEQGRVVLANQQIAQMLLSERSGIIGRSVMDFVAPEARELVLRQLQSGIDVLYDHLALRTDGTTFPVEVQGRTMPYAGRTVRVTAIRDITERKKLEQQTLELVLEKERVNLLKEFLGNISHDLKTPLSVINTSLYLLERLNDPDKQKDKLQQIKLQVQLLDRFIQDILLMSRLDHEESLPREPIDLNSILTTIEKQLQPKTQQKAITVKLDLQSDIRRVYGSENELSRIFVNLLENALNYTPDDGQVMVKSYPKDAGMVVAVSDTGIGITEAELPHVFERFYRSDSARNVEAGGTGLGLAIVKKIVDMHNGLITVESVQGQGSTFQVWLPTVP